jgi:hypothetical protein
MLLRIPASIPATLLRLAGTAVITLTRVTFVMLARWPCVTGVTVVVVTA